MGSQIAWMVYFRIFFFISLLVPQIVGAQTITGHLSYLSYQSIQLEGFNGLNTYLISSTSTDAGGNFRLTFSKTDYGVGYLKSGDQPPFLVILTSEDIVLNGESMENLQTLKVTRGQENQWFGQYAREHPKREQILSAWDYLNNVYSMDSLFSMQEKPLQTIQEEKKRIQQEDAAFLEKLPEDSYVSWLLPIRKRIHSVPLVIQFRPDEIPALIRNFRSVDYTDPRLYKSGLLKDVVDSHFWLIENSGLPLDSVFTEMQTSIDSMLRYLIKDNKILNEVTDYIFNLLEQHSLFPASEYLALKVLQLTNCTLDSDLAKQLESYRAMKKGNTAPDILFLGDLVTPGHRVAPARLSDIKSDYKLVFFGASWCLKCMEELPEVAKHYAKWKAQNVEVVFISLDDDKNSFFSIANDLPFISVCDYQKWNSVTVNDYHIFATPTLFLLDQNQQILLRPQSVRQMDSWVDWYLVKASK